MNQHEMAARARKAELLADALFLANCTDEDVLNASAEDWIMAANMATQMQDDGQVVRPPNSADTVEAVRKALARRYADAEDKRQEANWEDLQMMNDTPESRTPGRE